MTQDEQRAYAKGYSTGRKRMKVDCAREIERQMREDFIQRMMISIAPQIIESPWGTTKDGKFIADKGAQQIMGTVRLIATKAADRCNFTAPPVIDKDDAK